MQINGLREFTEKFTPALQSMGKQNQSPMPVSLHDSDALNISEIGKRLRYSGAENVNRARLKASSNDPISNLMERSVSSMEEILEKMHALASSAATDGKLSDLDRMDMQIEMEDLRAELRNVSGKMNKKLAEMSGYYAKGGEFENFEAEAGAKSVLERARERIKKGKQWDIAEGGREFQSVNEVITNKNRTITPDKDGTIAADLADGEAAASIAGEITGSEYYALSDDERAAALYDGISVPTVREKLEAAGTIILMDVTSAKKGLERMEAEMEKLHAMKDEFIAFKSDARKNRDASITELSSMRASYAAMREALRIKKEKEASERGSDPDETELILTPVGIMKTDDNGNNPKLVHTGNPKGDMFSKLGRFFESTAGSLSAAFIDEGVHTTSVVNTNVTWNSQAA